MELYGELKKIDTNNLCGDEIEENIKKLGIISKEI
jgi:hypothetical protein